MSCAAYYFLPIKELLRSFTGWAQAQGALGVIAFALLYVAVSVTLLAPAELMSVAAGVVYGAWGAPLVVLSAVIAAMLAFMISRYMLRSRVRAFVARRPLLGAIDAALEEEGWQIALLLRLNALIPFNFQNYFFGITDIGLLAYAITTFLGVIPLTAMYVYLGSLGQSLAADEDFVPSKIAFLSFSLAVTAAVVYLVTRKVKGKLQEMSAAQE
jgi:uncharacterized membrane protein YdjX (TVP38/TMEM64 family)